jgi:hypothetical protein
LDLREGRSDDPMAAQVGVGLGLEKRGNSLVVVEIIQDGPVHVEGSVRLGDQLVKVGKRACGPDLAETRQLLLGPAGSRVQLTFKRHDDLLFGIDVGVPGQFTVDVLRKEPSNWEVCTGTWKRAAAVTSSWAVALACSGCSMTVARARSQARRCSPSADWGVPDQVVNPEGEWAAATPESRRQGSDALVAGLISSNLTVSTRSSTENQCRADRRPGAVAPSGGIAEAGSLRALLAETEREMRASEDRLADMAVASCPPHGARPQLDALSRSAAYRRHARARQRQTWQRRG